MSKFVLKKEYQLELPTSYVDIDCDEMEYVDGGKYWSHSTLKGNLIGWGISATYLSSAVGFTRVYNALKVGIAAIKTGLKAGGVFGTALGWYVSYKASVFLNELSIAIRDKKGIEFGMSWSGSYMVAR